MEWLRRFMYGRRGMDQLNLALLIASFICILLSRILFRGIFSLLALAALAFCYYRALSRDVYRRAAENQKFMRFWQPAGANLRSFASTIKDRKTHCHCQCPACKQKIRLPKGRGRLEVTCPKCGQRFIKET